MAEWDRWEDYRHGLYDTDYTDQQVAASAKLLADPQAFGDAARQVVATWPVASQQNLRHMWSGRNAWLGQATCLWAHGAPAAATRQAWAQLTQAQQRQANSTATAIRTEWEAGDHASQTLFGS